MNSKEEEKEQNEFLGIPFENESENSDEITALTNNIARLETSLDSEREERLEERFRWIFSLILLFTVLAANILGNSWTFLPIFMLELVFLIGCAKACGVDWAERLIGQLLYNMSKRKINS